MQRPEARLLKPQKYEIVSQLLILIGVTLTSMFVFSIVGIGVAMAFYDVSIADLQGNYSELGDQKGALLVFQAFSSIGTFLLPAFLVPKMIKSRPAAFLGIRKLSPLYVFILAGIAYGFTIPALEAIIEWNANIGLPKSLDFLEGMFRASEDSAAELTDLFLKMDGPTDLIINLFVMALLPAVAEEFFFRALLQRLIFRWTGKAWIALLVAAFVFSAFHFQFYGFFPRFLLGLLLGYLLILTGSIWVPVFVHMLNNGLALVSAYQFQMNENGSTENLNSMDYPAITVIIGLGLCAIVLFYLARISSSKTKKTDDDQWVSVYESGNRHQAEILVSMLETKEIPAVLMNKRDSSYLAFGQIQIMVKKGYENEARDLIAKQA